MKSLKYILIIGLFPALALSQSDMPSAETIIQKIDDNMSSKNRIFESDMVIYGKRRDRTVTSKSYS